MSFKRKKNTRKILISYWLDRDKISQNDGVFSNARNHRLNLQIILASSFLALNNGIKSNRDSTHSYRLKIKPAVMTMINKRIRIILLLTKVLEQTKYSVPQKQITSNDRLTLAIPLLQILTYFETIFLLNVALLLRNS